MGPVPGRTDLSARAPAEKVVSATEAAVTANRACQKGVRGAARKAARKKDAIYGGCGR